ncbi:MAG: aconitase X [Clostridia bacterium]|nr:aconitase X [Clostridia bacterium]
MKLNKQQKNILEGGEGEIKALMMKTLVMFGDIFGAQKMASVTHKTGHLVTSFGIGLLKPLYRTMDRIIAEELKAEGGFTVDPRPIDYSNVKCSPLEKLVFSKIMYSRQKEYEEQLKKVGLKNDNAFSCTCYLDEVGNTPKEGDVLSWAESSAVVFANSVLGARCNRNSGMFDLFGAILGCVPEFGLLTDEGRKADWIVRVQTSSKPEAQVLGSAIGLKVMEDVPYVEGLDKFLGDTLDDAAIGYLKDFGAATASNGAVGLYHIHNLTPEAKRLGKSLIKDNVKEYIIDDAELERVYKAYPIMWKKPGGKPQMCFIGCPHLTFRQLNEWTERISSGLSQNARQKVAIRTVLSASPDVVEKFKKTDGYQKLKNTGASLTSICPLMYTNNPLTRKRNIATSSNKLRTYSAARYYKDSHLLDIILGKEGE